MKHNALLLLRTQELSLEARVFMFSVFWRDLDLSSWTLTGTNKTPVVPEQCFMSQVSRSLQERTDGLSAPVYDVLPPNLSHKFSRVIDVHYGKINLYSALMP